MPKPKQLSKNHTSPSGTETPAQSRLHIPWPLGITLIVVAVFFVYFPSLGGEFLLDDDQLLTANDLVKASDGLYRFWCTTEAIDYWPVTNTAFWIEWRLWAMHSTGYHITNLILHVIEALLLWLILRKLAIPGAFLAALIFALHPINVESVAWIASQKNLMAMLFFLLSILWYVKYSCPRPEWISRPAMSPLNNVLPTAHHPLPTFILILQPSSFSSGTGLA